MKLYLRLARASLSAQLRYPASLLLMFAAQLFTAVIDFLSVMALFGRFGSMGGWAVSEIALLYGMANISFSLGESAFRKFDLFHEYVSTGSFDRVLLRPRTAFLQVLGGEVTLRRLGRIACCAVLIGYSAANCPISWDFALWALLICSMLSGALVYGGLFLINAATCFWSIGALEIFNLFTNGGCYAAQYPMEIYTKWLAAFFLYVVPVGALNYLPASLLLGRGYASPTLAWLSPLIGIAFFALCVPIWRFGVRHYRSTGS